MTNKKTTETLFSLESVMSFLIFATKEEFEEFEKRIQGVKKSTKKEKIITFY